MQIHKSMQIYMELMQIYDKLNVRPSHGSLVVICRARPTAHNEGEILRPLRALSGLVKIRPYCSNLYANSEWRYLPED